MAGFFLTNSIKLSQVSAFVNLVDPSLRFGMIDGLQCLEKKDQNNQNTVQGEFGLCTRVKISA